MGRFSVEMELTNHRDVVLADAGALPTDRVRRTRIRGMVDCGASHLVIPEAIATRLGVPSAGVSNVSYALERTTTRQVVEDVQVELQGRHGTFRAIVEPSRTTALIGAIVLEDLDFLVDSRNQRLIPRDPDRIVAGLGSDLHDGR